MMMKQEMASEIIRSRSQTESTIPRNAGRGLASVVGTAQDGLGSAGSAISLQFYTDHGWRWEQKPPYKSTKMRSSLGAHPAHAVVSRVRDIQVSGAINRDAKVVQQGAGRRPPVAAEAELCRIAVLSRYRGDDAGNSVYTANHFISASQSEVEVVTTADEEVIGCVDRDLQGLRHAGECGRAAIAPKAVRAIESYSGDVVSDSV